MANGNAIVPANPGTFRNILNKAGTGFDVLMAGLSGGVQAASPEFARTLRGIESGEREEEQLDISRDRLALDERKDAAARAATVNVFERFSDLPEPVVKNMVIPTLKALQVNINDKGFANPQELSRVIKEKGSAEIIKPMLTAGVDFWDKSIEVQDAQIKQMELAIGRKLYPDPTITDDEIIRRVSGDQNILASNKGYAEIFRGRASSQQHRASLVQMSQAFDEEEKADTIASKKNVEVEKIMKDENVDFPEALRRLNERVAPSAGITRAGVLTGIPLNAALREARQRIANGEDAFEVVSDVILSDPRFTLVHNDISSILDKSKTANDIFSQIGSLINAVGGGVNIPGVTQGKNGSPISNLTLQEKQRQQELREKYKGK